MRSVKLPTTSGCAALLGSRDLARGRGVGRCCPPVDGMPPGGDTIGDRVTAGHLEIGAHPGDHPLEAGHVLVDLPAVVAPEDDVETGARRARPHHSSSLVPPERAEPSTPPRVGRSRLPNLVVHPDGAYRRRPDPRVSERATPDAPPTGTTQRLPSTRWTPARTRSRAGIRGADGRARGERAGGAAPHAAPARPADDAAAPARARRRARARARHPGADLHRRCSRRRRPSTSPPSTARSTCWNGIGAGAAHPPRARRARPTPSTSTSTSTWSATRAARSPRSPTDLMDELAERLRAESGLRARRRPTSRCPGTCRDCRDARTRDRAR